MGRAIVPIFFACDEEFVKYMLVTIRSVMENASDGQDYRIYVLNTSISDARKKQVTDQVSEDSRFTVEFVNVTPYLDELKEKLPLRDYYSLTTYYPIFL